MNSLSSVLEKLSLELGVEIKAEENSSNDLTPFSIRFASLDSNKSFKLNVSRSWKTTQISFKADSFAGEVVYFLCSEIYKNAINVYKLIEENQSKFSLINLEIDGKAFFGKAENLSSNPELTFEVEVLTPDSSISYGLLTTKEEELIEFSTKFFVSLLPISETVFRNPDEVIGFPEGAVAKVEVNKYERDPRNRRAAIAIHGKNCLACGFNFHEKYGDLGDDYIIVHHLTPVSAIGPNYVIDPEKDLATLCANCHAMIHRKNPPMSIEELKAQLKS